MRHLIAAAGACLFLGMASPAHAGATIKVADDKTLSVGLLLQPQLQLNDGASATGGWAYQPQIRRARVLLYGKFTDKIHFFAETDNPRIGADGWAGSTFIQDAWVEFNVSEALQVDMGMLLIPFSHHGMQGATSLLMADYHGGLISYPTGSHRIWRDVGIMARGELLDRNLEYRLAVTQGVPTQPSPGEARGFLNPNGLPRLTAHLRYNLVGHVGGAGVGGFYYSGIRLKEKDGRLVSPRQVVSFGLSTDWQHKAVPGATGSEDNLSVAADAFVDLPLGDGTRSVNAQANFYLYDLSLEDSLWNAFFVEGGYRIHRVQPLLAFERIDTAALTITNVMGGAAWWYLGHRANLKGQLGASMAGDATSLSALVQSQLYF